MDTITLSHDTQVTVAPPTAYPIAAELIAVLSTFLGTQPSVRSAFLVQFSWPPGYDPAVGDAPCLTCVLQLDDTAGKDVFDQISADSQTVVDGRLGPWRFLDFFRHSDSISKAIDHSASPFYTRC